ncbi:MAG TPA: tetratricopeptide repeat protein [bacterium]|nr:tetratricopeptide repeat protein [bacterium]
MSPQSRVQGLLEQGLYYYGLGEVKKAIELWREVLSLDPGNETAREYIEIETGRPPEVKPAQRPAPEEILEPDAEVTEKLPDAPVLADDFLEGQRLLQHEDWSQVIKEFEAAHRFDPANPLYWTHVELARAGLIKSVIERAGGIHAVISLKVPLTELIGRKDFTQEEGFVLSLVSGETSLMDVISLSPIPRFQTYQIIRMLLDDGLLKTQRKGR